jgi:hypothetical protein
MRLDQCRLPSGPDNPPRGGSANGAADHRDPAKVADSPMRPPSPQDDHSHEPLMRRLDRAAGEINPFLMVLILGLVILNLTCFVALMATHIPIAPVHSSPSAAATEPR